MAIPIPATATEGRSPPPTLGPEGSSDAKGILDATEAELAAGHAWIVYRGPSKAPIPAIRLRSSSVRDLELEEMRALRKPTNNYGVDWFYSSEHGIAVTPAELHRMLVAVKPILTREGVSEGSDYISFTVATRTARGITGYEFLISQEAREAGKAFYQALLDGLDPSNTEARSALAGQRTNVARDPGD